MKAIGDWNKQMAIPMDNALTATIELTGKSGRDACKRAMIFMAQSARAITPQAKKNRKVLREKSSRYFEVYKADGSTTRRYDWMYRDGIRQQRRLKKKTFEEGKEITQRGIAKRSWFWAIDGIKAPPTKPIPGVGELHEVIGDQASGFIASNRLGYINKIMPSGWEQTVHDKASNRVMANAARAMERKFSMTIPRLAASRAKRAQKKLAKAWRESK